MEILSKTKSDSGSPTVYYTVNASVGTRTATTVDITIEVITRLANSGSYLGAGKKYGINTYIKLNGEEHLIVAKGTGESWEGTANHYSTETITVENISPSATELTGITFRAIRTSGNTANAGYLEPRYCSNITIPTGHTPPSDVAYTMTETNQKLINAGIGNDKFVNQLSVKSFNFTANFYEGAVGEEYTIFNRIVPYSTNTLPLIIDFRQEELLTALDNPNKVLIRGRVIDSKGGVKLTDIVYYDYVDYSKISLIETATKLKRNGQISGKVFLNVKGNLFNGIIGNVNQSQYKPTIKYKYWKRGDVEPSTFDNTIPSANITTSGNTFSVNDFEIGSPIETDSNYFNPDFAYQVKIYVEDNFTSYTSQEKSIPVGEATWTEYQDRVDFKKITIKGEELSVDSGPKLLTDDYVGFMNGSQSLTLREPVSAQPHGIILVWSAYANDTAQNYDFNYIFIPKTHIELFDTNGVSMRLTNDSGSKICSKYIYVSDNFISGNDVNGANDHREANVDVSPKYFVLRYVIGV